MKKKFFLCALALCGVLNAGEVSIAAAANTTYAFDEIKAEFEKLNPDTKLNVSLGASGALNTQIKNGAPFDIFMAADMKFADDLFEAGFATAKAQTYAKGKVAMFSVRGVDLGKGLDALKDEKVKTISIANPKTAPYGTASVEAMQKAEIFDSVKGKIVEAKSIGEALTQALSAADIGFVAASAMYAPKMKEGGCAGAPCEEGKHFVLVPSSLYEPIAQGMVILKKAQNNAEAKAFYDFILSDKGREIFAKYGYEF
ncbi:molybdate ABC transporter substrate-binding protein [Campylobacter sp. JMF_04 NA10]|uniref:molybdate ABC transporter substrate-binding protein n=1 Tax=Campylobacter sp. JMF_04 NA10 TaxID=2983824 RepID=UPI0022EA0E21|nr:molybdate ABC transporter substrate-binding protein [Campylobacter sp. JMF_04 NA10]MDA3076120.1 molybdate ABC transporter substrate-binding protein [Campylobacter sp. JMF_04 NA10]